MRANFADSGMLDAGGKDRGNVKEYRGDPLLR